MDIVSNKVAGLYENLARLNQYCEATVAIIQALGTQGVISKNDAAYYCLMVEEARASSSQCVLEHLDEREVRLAGVAFKRRKKFEETLSEM
jgi:hypothetical protein